MDALAPWLGFNDNAIRAGQITADGDALLTEGVGAGVHRLTFDWRQVEPEPGVLRLEAYDGIYRAMLARGIRPLFILMFAPPWAWDGFTFCRGDCRYPPARAHYPAWRRIAGLIATRYPASAGIEIWNEPNEPDFWFPRPDVSRYTELLKEAYGGIKRANPGMPVVTGGFSNRRSNEGDSLGLPEFLEGMYAAGGRGHFDVLGFHAYPETPALDAIPHTLRAVRDIPARHGDSAAPLWVTETGLSTTGPAGPALVSEQQQAEALIAVIRTLRDAGVRRVLVHSLLDPPGDAASRDSGYGVVHPNLRPKPAYCALAREAGVRTPCR